MRLKEKVEAINILGVVAVYPGVVVVYRFRRRGGWTRQWYQRQGGSAFSHTFYSSKKILQYFPYINLYH